MKLYTEDNSSIEKRGFAGSSPDGELTKPGRQPMALHVKVRFWVLRGRRADGAGCIVTKACMLTRKVSDVSFP